MNRVEFFCTKNDLIIAMDKAIKKERWAAVAEIALKLQALDAGHQRHPPRGKE